MKKLLSILLALTLCLSFFACGDDEENNSSSSQNSTSTQTSTGGGNSSGGSSSSFDLGSIMTGNGATDTVWGKQDAATKQEIIAAGKAEGVDISFGADGSMTIVDPESGVTMTQAPNGTWTFSDGSGSQGQLGGNWPDNEFTRLIPRPEFQIAHSFADSDYCQISFSSVSVEQVKAYVQLLKTAGFTLNASENDLGSGTYTFEAQDAKDNTIAVYVYGGTCTLMISKN